MTLAIQLVTWNGARYIAPLFESIKRSTHYPLPTTHLLVLDNGSTDGTVEALKQEMSVLPFHCELIELKENIGFAGGHNRLFAIGDKAISDSEYVFIVNQDIVFEPECIANLAQFLDRHPEAAAVAPRLMRLSRDVEGLDGMKTGAIDSLGFKKYRSWRVADIGAGAQWHEKKPLNYETMKPYAAVFGVSGACAMFRMSALCGVAFPDGTIFDESYGSYKEDVDLAFRLASISSKLQATSYVVLDAVAYHARGSGDGKKDQPFAARYQSYRNHLATLYKNFSLRHILDFPFIVWYEARKFCWYLLFDRKVLGVWRELWGMREELKKKREYI